MERVQSGPIPEGLRKLHDANTAARFFDWVIDNNYRERAGVTEIDQIVTASRAERGEVVSLCKELEKLGIGRFMVGRRGKPSRIEWNYDLLEISKIAIGSGSQEIETGEPKGRQPPAEARLIITVSKIPRIPIDRLAYSIARLAENLGVNQDDIDITFKV